MKRWKPEGWVSMMSDADSGAEDWRWCIELLRRMVLGEWMASGAVAAGVSGSSCVSNSAVGTLLHRLHRRLNQVFILELYGGGGDLVSSSERPRPVSSTSSKPKGVPF